MPDHVRMLPAIPPKHGVSSVMGCLKGKSWPMIFDKRANLKHKFSERGSRKSDFSRRWPNSEGESQLGRRL